MKRAAAALLTAALLMGAPALAKSFVHDDAQMLGASTVAQLDTRIGNFNAQTGKEIVIQTVPSVTGGDVRAAAEAAFAQQQVNGVLIFVDKGDRKDWIIPDRAAVQAGWWSSQTSSSIAHAMETQFRVGDYDAGVTSAVDGSLNVYRSHTGSLRGGGQPSYAQRGTYAQQTSSGVHISMFMWILIAVFAFFILRSIMRAASGPRYGPGAPGVPGGPGGAPGGGYGYGGGFGGGGGFFSGLLGGLGGAWLGNEMFGGRQDAGTGAWGNTDPTAGGGGQIDGGGWQSDPGQADVGGGGGGDWGGGGFGGGGGGDFGGGGGGDAGGGW
ncbi:MAG: TPM domain-containing protein [Candidatus Baltobacteraceae bacterium]